MGIAAVWGLGKNIELAKLFFSPRTGDGTLDVARLGAQLGASLPTSSTLLCSVVRLLLLVVSIQWGWNSPTWLAFFGRLLLLDVSIGIGAGNKDAVCKGLRDIVERYSPKIVQTLVGYSK